MVQALPTYLKAPGLQLIVRATRAGAADCSVQLERVRVIATQHDELQEVLKHLGEGQYGACTSELCVTSVHAHQLALLAFESFHSPAFTPSPPELSSALNYHRTVRLGHLQA